MSTENLPSLFQKYLQGTIGPEEFAVLHKMIRDGYDREAIDPLLAEALSDPSFTTDAEEQDKEQVFATLLEQIGDHEAPQPSGRIIPFYRRPWLRWTAIVVLLLTGGLYWHEHRRGVPKEDLAGAETKQFDLPPGHNGAILTLADGRTVELDSAHNGAITRQGDALLLKEAGRLTYRTDSTRGLPIADNMLTTPRGRQFQLQLSDGTRVWLNAASSIRFPAAFTGTERKVAITGEAYFDVTRDKARPFIVETNGARVAVLGTSFDIMNYGDERSIHTTLVSGSVRLTGRVGQALLEPGQEGKIEKETGRLLTHEVDTDQTIAWTKGRLALGNTDFAGLMRQIARWYDVDVVFQGKAPDVHIGGTLHRDVNLSTVLQFLQENGVHYKTQDKTIIILP